MSSGSDRHLDPDAPYVKCERCGMSSFGDDWLGQHECPEPLPYEVAAEMARAYAGGPPISPRLYARIKLGLARQSEGKSDG